MFCLMTLLVSPTCRCRRHYGIIRCFKRPNILQQLTSTSHLKELSRRNLLNPKMLSTKMSSTRKANKRARMIRAKQPTLCCAAQQTCGPPSAVAHTRPCLQAPPAHPPAIADAQFEQWIQGTPRNPSCRCRCRKWRRCRSRLQAITLAAAARKDESALYRWCPSCSA